MNIALKNCRSKWAGRCKTMDECQEGCRKTKGCRSFNWWPGKGGCRHILTEADKCRVKKTGFTTVFGSPECEATVVGPTNCDTCGDKCEAEEDPLEEEESDAEDPAPPPLAAACSMNTAFKKCPSKWAGRCTTLDECQETCLKTRGCKAFNWWPGKGGCRHILTEVSKCTEKKTEWTSVGGSPDCEATLEAPSDCDTCPKKCQKDPVDEEEDPLDEEEPEDDESSSLS